MERTNLKPINYLPQSFYFYNSNGYLANNDLSVSCILDELRQTCTKAREDWAFIVFSDLPIACLKRYFTYQLTSLHEALEQLQNPCQPQPDSPSAILTNQIAHLLTYFDTFTDNSLRSARAYQDRKLTGLKDQTEKVLTLVNASRIDPALKECMLPYLNQLCSCSTAISLTYRQLTYAEQWITTLLTTYQENQQLTDGKVIQTLRQLNFNHLGFFSFFKQQTHARFATKCNADRLKIIDEEISNCLPVTALTSLAYDPNWPTIDQLVKGWLLEEKAMKRGLSLTTAKLPLNLSVAQLACFLRVFFEENIFGQANLSELFKFIAGHYTTKRQQAISPGSLSKEFYSVSQVNAAVTRDFLQKMLARINKHYFPVWAAIIVSVFFR